MATALRSFIDKQCVRHQTGIYGLKAFVTDFRAYLPLAARADWTRGRILKELLKEGHLIANREKIAHVAGLAPKGQWVDVNGKLEFSRNAI